MGGARWPPIAAPACLAVFLPYLLLCRCTRAAGRDVEATNAPSLRGKYPAAELACSTVCDHRERFDSSTPAKRRRRESAGSVSRRRLVEGTHDRRATIRGAAVGVHTGRGGSRQLPRRHRRPPRRRAPHSPSSPRRRRPRGLSQPSAPRTASHDANRRRRRILRDGGLIVRRRASGARARFERPGRRSPRRAQRRSSSRAPRAPSRTPRGRRRRRRASHRAARWSRAARHRRR